MGLREQLQPVAHQDAVFARERHDVGHGRERHQVQEMKRQMRRQPQRRHERLRELECDARAAQLLRCGAAVGALRIEHRGRRGELVAGEMVVGDDDLDAGRPGGAYHLHRGDTTVAGDDQPGAQTARLGEPGRPEVVAVAQPVRDERVDPAADAREHTGEQRRGTLAVHVVVAVDQDRGTRPDGGDDELDRPRHIGPGVWIGETLEVRAEERFGELGRGEPALHEEGGERLRDVEVGREGRRELWIGRRRDRPAGGDHSGAYSSTPQASQPSIDAPRWIRARRCVGTAVKQWPQASPCSAYNASGALPRRIRS